MVHLNFLFSTKQVKLIELFNPLMSLKLIFFWGRLKVVYFLGNVTFEILAIHY